NICLNIILLSWESVAIGGKTLVVRVWSITSGTTLTALKEAGEGVVFLRSKALTASVSATTSGERPEVEVSVLTLATTGLFREVRTFNLFSIMVKASLRV
ncbi:hypothetical protein Tco_0063166, partial [Tanacetum coccineum]